MYIVTYGDCPTGMDSDGLFASGYRACVFATKQEAVKQIARARRRGKKHFPGLQMLPFRVIELEPITRPAAEATDGA